MIETPNPFRYVLAYLFWFITFCLTVFVLLQWRNTFFIVLAMTPWHRYVEHTINQFGFFILGIVSLCVIIYVEHFYRTGVEKDRLFARFFQITLIQMIVLLVAHLLLLIGHIVLELSLGSAWMIVAAELIGCGLLYWLYQRSLLHGKVR